MTLREVALDRDVRASFSLPSAASLRNVHFLRRCVGVAALLAIDVGSLLTALMVASLVADARPPGFWPGLTARGVTVACGTIVVASALSGLYGRRFTRHHGRTVLIAWVSAFVACSVLMLGVEPDGLGARLVAVWVTAFALALLGRWVLDGLLVLHYGPGIQYPRALLVGELDSCLEALPGLVAQPVDTRVNVVGLVVSSASRVASGRNVADEPPVVGTYDQLGSAVERLGAAKVIIADPASLNGQLGSVMDGCRKSRVPLQALATELRIENEGVTYLPGLDCPLFLVRPRPPGWSSYLAKRVMDHAGAALLLVVLSPVLLAIAALIKVTSPGPVLFTGRRVGIGQRTFRCYKFRTMVCDAEALQHALEAHNEAEGVLFKMRDDPRVTSIGRALRRHSLDELPQLLNVLKGDMSLVGPRPLPLRDNDLMEDWHRRRHVVLPGITGLWQVSGRSALGFDDMLSFDLSYIETWSLRSDLRILWLTFGSVLRPRGAY